MRARHSRAPTAAQRRVILDIFLPLRRGTLADRRVQNGIPGAVRADIGKQGSGHLSHNVVYVNSSKWNTCVGLNPPNEPPGASSEGGGGCWRGGAMGRGGSTTGSMSSRGDYEREERRRCLGEPLSERLLFPIAEKVANWTKKSVERRNKPDGNRQKSKNAETKCINEDASRNILQVLKIIRSRTR